MTMRDDIIRAGACTHALQARRRVTRWLQDPPPKMAVAMVLVRTGNDVLTITRRDNFADINLPGGRVDPGENFFEAAVREMREETGLEIALPTINNVIYARTEHDGYNVVTVSVSMTGGTVASSPEGFVGWRQPTALLGEQCTFREYNSIVMSIILGASL